ncbi:MAG: hypothetical protein KDI73_14585, partial [Candidatus Competibacteraceae bacterium]|nr:hypothetical protein [Candidatus Competibacteraceae bacterium]
AGRYLRFDLLAKEAKNLSDDAREQLLNRCRIHGLTNTVTSGAIQIKSRATWNREAIEARLSAAERDPFLRPKWDMKALVDLVRTLGGNPDAARMDAEPTLDLDAAAHWLMETRGLPESALRTTDYQSSLSRRKADQALVEPVRDAARTTTYQFGGNAPGL